VYVKRVSRNKLIVFSEFIVNETTSLFLDNCQDQQMQPNKPCADHMCSKQQCVTKLLEIALANWERLSAPGNLSATASFYEPQPPEISRISKLNPCML
jgi:hypothetical protein